ncbi:hypothetical protein G9P44_001376 [Scheffersomyces stipitis]|nr:hypothetical protein G9P44_001376 [Scheffersomyces stipitis]
MKFQAAVLSLFAASAMAIHVEQALLNTDNMVLLMDDGEHFEFPEAAVIEEDEQIMKKSTSTKAAKKTTVASAAPSTTVKKEKTTSVASSSSATKTGSSSSATKTKSKSHTASVTKTNGGAQVAGSVAAPLALIAGLLL